VWGAVSRGQPRSLVIMHDGARLGTHQLPLSLQPEHRPELNSLVGSDITRSARSDVREQCKVAGQVELMLKTP
jgi:hypothetical protein